MLAYHQTQLAYVLVSGALTVLAWNLFGRLTATRPVLRRFFAAGAAIAVPCGATALALLGALGEDKSKLFAPVAIAFYGGAFWLPLTALITLAATRSARTDVETDPRSGAPLHPGMTRSVKRRTGDSRNSRAVVAVLSFLVLAIGVWSTAIEPNLIGVRNERIEIDGWRSGRPLRVIHVSDLQTVGPCRRDRRAAEMINAERPDLVIITGDYIAGPYTDPWPALESARQFLAALEAPLGVVLTRGHCVPKRFQPNLIDGLDVTMLMNEVHRIDLDDGRRVRIVGLGVYETDVEMIDPPRDEDELVIVASHVPDLTRELTGKGVHLHLAGHTHGGQVVIPGFGAPLTLSTLPRRYARGLFLYEDHWLNVTAGIGMEGHHAPRVRFCCPPEICVLEIVGGR